MNLNLQGKNIVVCGGSSGIGLACVELFLQEKANVTMIGRDKEKLIKAMNLYSSHDNNLDWADIDLRNPSQAQKICEYFGIPDVMVNCQGSAKQYDNNQLTNDNWQDSFTDKFISYTNVTTHVLKQMAIRGSGAIVHVIGIGGTIPAKDHLPGCAANAALILLTKGQAQQYAAQGIRVNAVSPAMVETPRLKKWFEETAERRTKEKGYPVSLETVLKEAMVRFPANRLIDLNTVANTVGFLASNISQSINGTNIIVDAARF